MSSPSRAKALYFMVGGFLGAGKTTAILKLAELLRQRGKKVGLIANDQSYGLVDTQMFAGAGFAVEEITGGCFCCKFNSLVEASEKLGRDALPDVFIAEPVGSCTDLKATVDYPLRRMYGEQYTLAPFSVLVDPHRAARVLGLETGKSFSPKVLYIYEKQLEEADILVINKIDLLAAAELAALRQALTARYPKAKIIDLCARQGTGVEVWLDELLSGHGQTVGAMDVDYDTYADGEAMLGWLNAAAQISAEREFEGNAWLRQLADQLHRELRQNGIEVAHLKLTLSPDSGIDLAVLNLVGIDWNPELMHSLDEPLSEGNLIINLRAEAAPETLRELVGRVIPEHARRGGCNVKIEHLEAFRPGRPTPTHRLVQV